MYNMVQTGRTGLVLIVLGGIGKGLGGGSREAAEVSRFRYPESIRHWDHTGTEAWDGNRPCTCEWVGRSPW